MARKSRSLAALVSLLVLAIAPAAALAYILPAEAILAGVAKRRADIAFTTIIAEGTYQKGDGPQVPVWEAIKEGKAHRIERKSAAGTEVVLTAGNKRWSYKLGEKAAPAARVANDLVLTFLASAEKDGGGQRGMAFLRAHNIDDNKITLARQDKRVAYVIGAEPWEPNKPQLWIDKELLVPVRLIEVEKPSGAIVETRLLGIGSATTGEWYPQRIEVWRDGKLVEATTYSNARINEDVSDELFRAPS